MRDGIIWIIAIGSVGRVLTWPVFKRCSIEFLVVERPVRALGFAAVFILTALALTGCASVPVDKPCGVIRDSLSSVKATNASGQQRLDVHYERGRAAGCW